MIRSLISERISKAVMCRFLILLIALQSANAESDKVPSIAEAKVSLLHYWEQTIEKDPSTKSFRKTDEPGVYYIDTDVLQYKGRIAVLNVVVDVYKPVGRYDQSVVYGGVVETKLLDEPDVAQVQPFSFSRWQRLGWFDYDGRTNGWFPFNKWDEHFPIAERGKAHPQSGI